MAEVRRVDPADTEAVIVLTGAAGFVGSEFVASLVRDTQWRICIIDRLDTSGTLLRISQALRDVDAGDRVQCEHWDLKHTLHPTSRITEWLSEASYVLHMAASSHVDRSIVDPTSFVEDNVMGTTNLLEAVRAYSTGRLQVVVNFSTDEVFGSIEVGAFDDDAGYASGNPYSASKAGAEEIGVAYFHEHDLPLITSHCMNIVGPRQLAEKFIPLVAGRLLRGEKIQVCCREGKPGKRHYIHTDKVYAAIRHIMQHGALGEKYNIVGEELDNLEVVQEIAKAYAMDPEDCIERVEELEGRPGNDFRYALAGEKLAAIGFDVPKTTRADLQGLALWLKDNVEWTVAIKQPPASTLTVGSTLTACDYDALVVGCDGFIGSHMYKTLTKFGQRVRGVSRRLARPRDDVVFHDLRAPINTIASHALGSPRTVYFLVGSSDSAAMRKDRVGAVKDDVLSFAHLLDWARLCVVKPRVIYLSTVDMVQVDAGIERSPTVNAACKVACEQLAEAFRNTYGMSISIVRTTNVYGEGAPPSKLWSKVRSEKPVSITLAHDRLTSFIDIFHVVRFLIHAELNEPLCYLLQKPVLLSEFLRQQAVSEGTRVSVSSASEVQACVHPDRVTVHRPT